MAAKLLGRMRAMLNHEAAPSRAEEPRPAAVQYVHRVLAHTMGWRVQREMMTLAKALDLLAEGSSGAAADVIAQRMKALDLWSREGGSWERAEFLELIPPSASALAERSEDFMVAKEARLAVRAGIKGHGKEKGKGYGKDKGKGYGKEPAQAQPPTPAARAESVARRGRRRGGGQQ